MKKAIFIFLSFPLLFLLSFTGLAKEKYDPTTLVFPAFLHTYGIRKATKLHFMIYTKNKVKVRDPEGLTVVRLKSWDDPNSTEDDDEVTGYGVNSGENVIVYNTSMTGISIYGLKESGERALNRPTGIAANEDGDVYVADTGNNRVVRLKNPKRNLEFVRGIGSRGRAPGQFESPHGIALDTRGMVYVCDTGNDRVQIFGPDDQLHLSFGKAGTQDGELRHPTGIAVADGGERWSYFQDKFVVVVDLEHSRIQKFTLDGTFLKSMHLRDFGYQSGHLGFVALDYYNNIWVTDKQNHCVHKFDHELNYLTSFGRKGNGDKEFNEPRGIAIYRRFGQVFIAEKESAQYYWIGTDIFDFSSHWNREKGVIAINFFLTEPSFLSLTIKNEERDLGVGVFDKKTYFSGENQIYLDGNWAVVPASQVHPEDDANEMARKLQPVPDGTYEIQLKLEPTYSSLKHFFKEVHTSVTVR